MANIWQYWAEENPQALYGAMLPSASPALRNYWSNQYSSVYQDYMSQLGKMALSGAPPSLNFSEFLSSYPFTNYFNQLNPTQRGIRTSLYPTYKWNV